MDTVSVHDLILDRALNPRLHGVDQEIVELYASIFTEVVWPPILVERETHRLLDGWHRVEAAKRAGVYTLPVQWVEIQEEELFALAVKSNLEHGVRLSREDRYKAIARLQREGWTNERIAEFLGCSFGMVNKTEKAEDLRIRFNVKSHPAAELPTESLVSIVSLPQEYQEEIAELAAEVEASPGDVRRTVRAIKKEEVETFEDIRRTMTDPEFAKARKAAKDAAADGNWLATFSSLIDQLETKQISLETGDRDAAVALFKRVREWAGRQLSRLGAYDSPPVLPGIGETDTRNSGL